MGRIPPPSIVAENIPIDFCHNREVTTKPGKSVPLFMLVSLLILFTLPGVLRASETSDLVDSYFAQWNKPDSPGCVVGAMKDGKVVHEKGYGMANLEHGIAIT